MVKVSNSKHHCFDLHLSLKVIGLAVFLLVCSTATKSNSSISERSF